MSKILYIGNYLDSTSWGKLCRDYLTAMAQAGLDIAARPYLNTIGTRQIESPPLIKILEDKDSSGATTCIQQVPIWDAVVDRRFNQNIFIFGDLRYQLTNADKASLFRFANTTVLTTNQQTLELFRSIQAAYNIKVYQVDYPKSVVISEFQKEVYEPLEFLKNSSSYKFYTIGKISGRKNIRKLLQAFYLEFDKDENVDLVFKATADIDPAEAGKIITSSFEGVLNELGKYPIEQYRQPIIITGWSDDENLVQLHKSCNCFVSASWAEHQDYLVTHAKLAGNQVISKELLDYKGPERMIGELNLLNLTPYTYDKNDVIQDFDLMELRFFMRAAVQSRDYFRSEQISNHDFIKTLEFLV